MSSTSSVTTNIHLDTRLGKRKAHASVETHVLRLSSSPELPLSVSDSDFEPFPGQISLSPQVLEDESHVPHTKKRYQCTHKGCNKSYTKPSRLTEHERSHTGHRPFVCSTCGKSYLRDAHLHAHARSHLPESARPLVCPKEGCGKRFWTSQHLRVHEDWHNGLKLFHCLEVDCRETFSKNRQLRNHMCMDHAAPGTRPFPCSHDGCTKSFATNQHMRTHLKTHDEKRYTCVHSTCLPGPEISPVYFSTWTALQRHIRDVHPPTCSYPTCNGRTFSSQKGLRAHQKLHEERELEVEIDTANRGIRVDDVEPPRKKRRGGEIGRDWKCDVDGCDKDFKSKKALSTHIKVTHLGQRDHVCPHQTCGRTYGYRHLLLRHLSKAHNPLDVESSSDEVDDDEPASIRLSNEAKRLARLDIDTITGNAYAKRALADIASSRALRCPYPDLSGFSLAIDVDGLSTNQQNAHPVTGSSCEYAFSRAYDLRRHLKAVHSVSTDKESVDEWVKYKTTHRGILKR